MDSYYFRLNKTDFGIGKVQLLVKETEQVLTLEITGSEEVANTIAADETQAFSWILYPPKIYFRSVPYALINGVKMLTISEELLDNYDVAFYLLAHSDLAGILSVATSGIITFIGTAQIDGKDLPLEVFCVAAS
ncbi:hypothetical protein [Hymenobacter sp. PAMC 26628]|uniref:hypothetical protein n=1 Tax=Hymenobacter sp. PAMC 26628 TaxID=1484118 RepID=UPI000770017D|nr:hypothetical protein [Hymenobacter sp. PAMC 26628]AMJ64640.1 hypothetical protein AXW84_03755 [Hymenobacter sp. PAMC 26628]